MSVLSHEFDLAQATVLPSATGLPNGAPDVGELSNQWEAVHEAAAAVGNLAQLARAPEPAHLASLPLHAAELGGWHYDMVARGIEDLAAVMQPGLRALLSLTAQGQETTAAALTLWREFHSARDAILDIVAAE